MKEISQSGMSSKQLAIALSQLKVFDTPSIKEEQYPTDSNIAAQALWHAHMQGWIENKVILDMGCGTGILGIGCLLLGAKQVHFVDVDEKALSILKENLDRIDVVGKATIHHQDALSFSKNADLVVQNPPFGTKQKHLDADFLIQAFLLAPHIVSFHKTSTQAFINQTIQTYKRKVVSYEEYQFPLKATMDHHQKERKHILVSCWHISK